MAKNPHNYSKPQTFTMSPPHAHTVNHSPHQGFNQISADEDEDEDDDICPVCDGECTCDNRPKQSFNFPTKRTFVTPPTSPGSSSVSPPPPPQRPTPSLVIRLPQAALAAAKRRAPAPSSDKLSDSEPVTIVKTEAEPSTSALYSHEHVRPISSASRPPIIPKRRGRPPKALVAARELAAKNGELCGPYGQPYVPPRSHKRKDPSTKAKSARQRPIPKNKSKAKKASGQSKKKRVMTSDSESSSLTDEDEYHDDNRSAAAPRFPTFVPASVMSASVNSTESDAMSLSGFETDGSIEAEEESFIVDEEQRSHDRARARRELQGDEPRKDDNVNWVIKAREKSAGLSDTEMDVDSTEDEGNDEEEHEEFSLDEETDSRDTGYAGVATTWSEDDESSLDADLFFANLADTSDESTSDSDVEQPPEPATTVGGLIPLLQREMEVTPFDTAPGWDGQIVFSNGPRDGGMDMDFEHNANRLVVYSSTSQSQCTDMDMSTDDEWDDDTCGLRMSDGETTEEELVGADGLPTEKAMKLFKMPSSVSAINPMSTMSPSVSPGPRNRGHSFAHQDSPKPADILAGKIYWEDSDDHDEDHSATRSVVRSSRGGGPLMGRFDTGFQSTRRRAVIDGTNKHVPSPFPRHMQPRGRPTTRHVFSSLSRADHSLVRTPSLPGSASTPTSYPLSSEELNSTSPEPAELIDLDDVLNASFLDSDPIEQHNEGDSRKHVKNLNRWDVISVGAFRQTRESAYMSDGASGTWAPDAGVMRSSLLNSMLWQGNKGAKPLSQTNSSNFAMSPVMLPTEGSSIATSQAPLQEYPVPKTRKELRREKKLKRKNFGPIHHHHHHQQHQHHRHSHHPNLKSRASSSVQRTNFFGPSAQIPHLNL